MKQNAYQVISEVINPDNEDDKKKKLSKVKVMIGGVIAIGLTALAILMIRKRITNLKTANLSKEIKERELIAAQKNLEELKQQAIKEEAKRKALEKQRFHWKIAVKKNSKIASIFDSSSIHEYKNQGGEVADKITRRGKEYGHDHHIFYYPKDVKKFITWKRNNKSKLQLMRRIESIDAYFRGLDEARFKLKDETVYQDNEAKLRKELDSITPMFNSIAWIKP